MKPTKIGNVLCNFRIWNAIPRSQYGSNSVTVLSGLHFRLILRMSVLFVSSFSLQIRLLSSLYDSVDIFQHTASYFTMCSITIFFIYYTLYCIIAWFSDK